MSAVGVVGSLATGRGAWAGARQWSVQEMRQTVPSRATRRFRVLFFLEIIVLEIGRLAVDRRAQTTL